MESHEPHMVRVADGRELEVVVGGPADGFPLVFFPWTPAAAVPFGLLERAAAERGLRVVSYSRPGYGHSTPRADADTTATVVDDAADTAAILDHLGLGEFVTIAWSGGGPRAFACAAMLPDRCRAAASLASPVPPDQEGIDQSAGMRPENAALYAAIGQGLDKEAFTAILEQQIAPLLSATDEQIIQSFRAMYGPADNAALNGEFAEYHVACVRHGVAQGVVGWRDDLFTYTRPWGFELERISVPMSIWHGSDDVNLGAMHGRWLGEHVPGAGTHIVEGAGHISLIVQMNDVVEELWELARL